MRLPAGPGRIALAAVLIVAGAVSFVVFLVASLMSVLGGLERVETPGRRELVLEPGDVAVFGGFTPHRSDPNVSGRWRRQLYLSYNASSDGGDQREGLERAARPRGVAR